MNLLLEITKFLASKVNLVLGENIFYHEMPDDGDPKCVCVYKPRTPHFFGTTAQIDGSMHHIKVTIRHSNNNDAEELALDCYNWLTSVNSLDDILKDTGFVELLDGTIIYVWGFGTPYWEKADQQRRKYFSFEARVDTKTILKEDL